MKPSRFHYTMWVNWKCRT